MPTVFNILLNDLDDGPECTFSNFPGEVGLGKVFDKTEGLAVIQRILA